MNDVVISDCVLYDAYEKWYAKVSLIEANPSTRNTVPHLAEPITAG